MFKKILFFALFSFSLNAKAQFQDIYAEVGGYYTDENSEYWFYYSHLRVHKDGLFKSVVDIIEPHPWLVLNEQNYLSIPNITSWSINKISSTNEAVLSLSQGNKLAPILLGEPVIYIYEMLLQAGGTETIISDSKSSIKKVTLGKFNCREVLIYGVPSEYACEFRVPLSQNNLKVGNGYGFETIVGVEGSTSIVKYSLPVSNQFLSSAIGSALSVANSVVEVESNLYLRIDVGTVANEKGVDLRSSYSYFFDSFAPRISQTNFKLSKNQGFSLTTNLIGKPGTSVRIGKIGNQTVRYVGNVFANENGIVSEVKCQQIVGMEQTTSVCDFIYFQ